MPDGLGMGRRDACTTQCDSEDETMKQGRHMTLVAPPQGTAGERQAAGMAMLGAKDDRSVSR